MGLRLALDLGANSLGWALFRLSAQGDPTAIIKAGVRIFPNGRSPKDDTSLAVTRRMARAMRRRRDRLLRRKARLFQLLLTYGFMPPERAQQKALERLNPYALRAKGLDAVLTPYEFGRALFHLNQRRGFKSNRKTDKADKEAGALKSALSQTRRNMAETGARTIGEYLYRILTDPNRKPEQRRVRARLAQIQYRDENGKTRTEARYDLYIDREMIEQEFDALWEAQSKFDPARFNTQAKAALKDCLLYQRALRPVQPGRCTLLPDHPRAPLALPSQQRARLLQEVNHLRIVSDGLSARPLTLEARDLVLAELEKKAKLSFARIKALLKLPETTQFTIEDEKRQELKGNATSAILAKAEHFGSRWHDFPVSQQDAIVDRLLNEETTATLIAWLVQNTGVDVERATRIVEAKLPEGYGSLSAQALARIIPALKADVVTMDKAIVAAGFPHHSQLSHLEQTGEILPELPYYGQYLQRHVGFGTGKETDPPEKRYGRIANPTVHIGLNQVRVVVNELLRTYGAMDEIIVEVARELKQSKQERLEIMRQQKINQDRNERLRLEAAALRECEPEEVKRSDIEKLILWEELSFDVADRRCPYSGQQISKAMVLTPEVEIEHILPFSMTLDDSMNNKTLCIRLANRIKANRTPAQAKADFEAQGWSYESILFRASRMRREKRFRFAEDGYEQWQREHKDFIARALNDTRYLSRIAREYLSLICPRVRVIPGNMTALLRSKFGLNDILGLEGEKNRNDHRHHAVDACVIGVTDQGMLQRFANANKTAKEKGLQRLVENMPLPFPTYTKHVERAVRNIWVSYKPDHGYEGAMMEDTAWGLAADGRATRRIRDEHGRRRREYENKQLIPIASTRDPDRHGRDADGNPRPYKGYVGGSNFCIEIVPSAKGKWASEVISTFQAYQCIRTYGAEEGRRRLYSTTHSQSGQPLVMRLMIDDLVRMELGGRTRTLRVQRIRSDGVVYFADHNEANADARNRDKDDPFSFITKTAGSMYDAKARKVTVSPAGVLRDPGFRAG